MFVSREKTLYGPLFSSADSLGIISISSQYFMSNFVSFDCVVVIPVFVSEFRYWMRLIWEVAFVLYRVSSISNCLFFFPNDLDYINVCLFSFLFYIWSTWFSLSFERRTLCELSEKRSHHHSFGDIREISWYYLLSDQDWKWRTAHNRDRRHESNTLRRKMLGETKIYSRQKQEWDAKKIIRARHLSDLRSSEKCFFFFFDSMTRPFLFNFTQGSTFLNETSETGGVC